MNTPQNQTEDLKSEIKLRKSAELDLVHSEEIFSLLVDAVQDYAIFAMDTKGTILTWNLGGQRLKGYSPAEIIGTSFKRFYTKEDIDRQHPEAELKEAAQNGKYEEEGWRIRKDGSRFWANIVITALYDKAKNLRGFAKVTRDLSERKIAEDELHAAYADLEKRVQERTQELSIEKSKAEKAVKARDQFFSIASHELKTPLSSLKLKTQIRLRKILKGDVSEFAPDRLVELCKEDLRQIGRLEFLIDNMLDTSKLTSGTFTLSYDEDVDLNDLAEQVLKRMDPILRNAGSISTLRSTQTVCVRLDRHRIEQVLTNLLSNAAKYAPGKPVEVIVDANAEFAKITVSDQGKGISKFDQERIFRPFERVTANTDVAGLGLGLFIIKQIVEAHRGAIRVESEIDKGTRFIVEIPLK